jgi:hypothetical protein
MSKVFEVQIPSEKLYQNELNIIKNNLKENKIFDKVKKGDFIENTLESGYRMDGVYLIDENKNVIHLNYDDYEYGSIPYDFKVIKDFESDHFLRANFKNAYSNINLISPDINCLEFYIQNNNKITGTLDNDFYIFQFEDFINDEKLNNSLFHLESNRTYKKPKKNSKYIREPLEVIHEENESVFTFYE